jgi:hypothetical protein
MLAVNCKNAPAVSGPWGEPAEVRTTSNLAGILLHFRALVANLVGLWMDFTSLSSARRVCTGTCPPTFLNSIIGGRIDRSDNGHRAIRKELGLRLSGNTERPSQTLYSVACTTSISSQHDTSGRVLTRCTFMRAVEDRRVPSPHLSVTIVANWE